MIKLLIMQKDWRFGPLSFSYWQGVRKVGGSHNIAASPGILLVSCQKDIDMMRLAYIC